MSLKDQKRYIYIGSRFIYEKSNPIFILYDAITIISLYQTLAKL